MKAISECEKPKFLKNKDCNANTLVLNCTTELYDNFHISQQTIILNLGTVFPLYYALVSRLFVSSAAFFILQTKLLPTTKSTV
jgi:hypothetical protein